MKKPLPPPKQSFSGGEKKVWLREERVIGVKLAKYEERESYITFVFVSNFQLSMVWYKCEVMLELCHGILFELSSVLLMSCSIICGTLFCSCVLSVLRICMICSGGFVVDVALYLPLLPQNHWKTSTADNFFVFHENSSSSSSLQWCRTHLFFLKIVGRHPPPITPPPCSDLHITWFVYSSFHSNATSPFNIISDLNLVLLQAPSQHNSQLQAPKLHL
ncbi:unnamed protein product [Vicia faba]|uniref:Uncharacterized protein n=1 Tax=Vicia faba TaxID=3906 RepID=A0AAV1AM78_VICFA|nr:unnamed protein product [Vicia faba]